MEYKEPDSTSKFNTVHTTEYRESASTSKYNTVHTKEYSKPASTSKYNTEHSTEKRKPASTSKYNTVHVVELKEPKSASKCISCTYNGVRGERPATTICSPCHVLLIFSSEPPRNPRPSNFFYMSNPIT